jgi:hypothetical protein
VPLAVFFRNTIGGTPTVPLNEKVKSANWQEDGGITPGRGALAVAVGGAGHVFPFGFTEFRCVPFVPHQAAPTPSAYSRCAGMGRMIALPVLVAESLVVAVPTPVTVPDPEPAIMTGSGVAMGPESTIATSVTMRAGRPGTQAKSVRVTRGIPHGHTNGAAAVDPVIGRGQSIIGPPEISIAEAMAESFVGVPSMSIVMVVISGASPARPAAPKYGAASAAEPPLASTESPIRLNWAATVTDVVPAGDVGAVSWEHAPASEQTHARAADLRASGRGIIVTS